MKFKILVVLACIAITEIALAQQDEDEEQERAIKKSKKSNKHEPNTNIKSLDSPIINLVWCGEWSNIDSINDDQQDIVPSHYLKYLFALSDNGTLYRTMDYGNSWEDMNQYFKRKLIREYDLDADYEVTFDSIEQSPQHKQSLYFFDNTGYSFYTDSCGAEYRSIRHDPRFIDFRINGANDQLILAHMPQKCPIPNSDCFVNEFDVYVTQDLGKNWRLVLSNAYEASWDQLSHFAMVPDSRIIAVYNNKIEKNKKNGSPDDSEEKKTKFKTFVAMSDDYFETRKILGEDAFEFFQNQYYLFILTRNQRKSKSFSLLIALSFSGQYEPEEVEIPIQRQKDDSFTVVEASEGLIFVSINHLGVQTRLSSVYASMYSGQEFGLILNNNVCSYQGRCDFLKLIGNEGTYLANVYDHEEVARANKRKHESNVSKMKAATKTNVYENLQNFKQTLITFDYGAHWKPLRAPEFDSSGEPLNCSGQCSLHIFGPASQINGVYSGYLTPGIIIAVGSVGMTLTNSEDEINTYLSRDGGIIWEEILKGSHVFEVSNRGSIIVAAKDRVLTNEILYTWDQGLTWDTIEMGDVKMKITNIISEPSKMNQKFMIYGEIIHTNKTYQSVITSVDFKPTQRRVCEKIKEAGETYSDYEVWIPTSYTGQQCVLGKKMKIVRRKRQSKCFNNEQYDKRYYIDNCLCTADDWECDYGFNPDENDNNNCKPINQTFAKMMEDIPPKDCYGGYEIQTGYRKVPANVCLQGIDKGSIYKECPEEQPAQQNQDLDRVDQEPMKEENSQKRNFKQQESVQTAQLTNKQRKNIVIAVVVLIILTIGLVIYQCKGQINSKNEGSDFTNIPLKENQIFQRKLILKSNAHSQDQGELLPA